MIAKKSRLFCFLLLVAGMQVLGQETFDKIDYYGVFADHFGSVMLPNGNILIAWGAFDGDNKIIFREFSTTGQVVSNKFFISAFRPEVYDMKLTPDGGILIGGGTMSNYYMYYSFLLKLNQNLQKEWLATFSGSYKFNNIVSILPLDDEGFAVSAISYKSMSYNDPKVDELNFARIDKNGSVLWLLKSSFHNFEYPTNICYLPDGNFFTAISVKYSSIVSGSLYKVSADGKEYTRSNIHDTSLVDISYALPDKDGNYYLLASAKDNGDDAGNALKLMKVNEKAEILWSKEYMLFPGMAYVPLKIIPLSDGNLLLTARQAKWLPYLNDNQIIVAKVDPLGELIWYNYFGIPYDDNINAEIFETSGHSLFLVSNSYIEYYLARFNEDGTGLFPNSLMYYSPYIKSIEVKHPGITEIYFNENEKFTDYQVEVFKETSLHEYKTIGIVPAGQKSFVDHTSHPNNYKEKYYVRYIRDTLMSKDGIKFNSVFLSLELRDDSVSWLLWWNPYHTNYLKSTHYRLWYGSDINHMNILQTLDSSEHFYLHYYPESATTVFQVEAGSKWFGKWETLAKSNYVSLYNYNSLQKPSKQRCFIYPNPATDIVTLYAENFIRGINVINMAGKTLPTPITIFEKKASINLSSLPDGTYFISTRFKNGDMIIRQIIKTSK